MNRKTNLFYNSSSQNSNFLTFSNYTESLTGNFLSTSTKLFPSMFLCLKVPRLYESNIADKTKLSYEDIKQEFIQNWLVKRYENKMAFLRDYCKYNDDLVEKELLPLNYLLEYIYEYDPSTEIAYIDNITEHDYNGTFTDTICMINATKFKHAELDIDKSEDSVNNQKYANYTNYSNEANNTLNISNSQLNISDKYLYGWYERRVEKYRKSFDMNCDGHVDENDLTLYIENRDAIILSIVDEIKNGSTAIEEYERRLAELTSMVEYNKTVLTEVEPTGPKYFNIDVVENTIDGDCKCENHDSTCLIDESTGKCCCQLLGSKTEYEYVVSEEENYLEPLFDYPSYPVRSNYATDKLYDEAISKYKESIKYYKITSYINGINLLEEDTIVDNTNSIQSIEFNIIIPLYDVIDTNAETNSFIISEENYIELNNDSSENCMYIKNVPLGIWFSGSEPIILKRDAKTKLCPSWSLVIGSQFKPFPYSKQIPDEITSSAKADAFMTFAQILTRQNDMISKMSEMFKTLSSMNSRLATLESNIASMGTKGNIDDMNQRITDMKQYIDNQVETLNDMIVERDLVWVNREG